VSNWQPRAARGLLAAVLLAATFAAAENVTVAPVPKVVGPHLRLRVSLHNQPLKKVKLSFYTAKDNLKFVLVTDAHGMVNPPRLQPGIYRIEARLENDVLSDAYVKVLKDSKTDSFAMDLTPAVDAHQTWLAGVQKLPIAASVSEFKGTILDPGNGPIPNVDIRVVRRGMEFADRVVLRLKSDAGGHFAAQLEPGEYIAFFSEAGFRTEIVPFAVIKQGEATLRVVLNIGAATENVMISVVLRVFSKNVQSPPLSSRREQAIRVANQFAEWRDLRL
jgi:hypothetical protein